MEKFKLANDQTLTIREARSEDAATIIRFINQISKESDYLTFGEGEFGISEEGEAEFIKAIEKSDNRLMICGFIEEEMVGQLSFSGGARPRIKHTGEFGVSVLKTYWGLGIGTALVNYMIQWAMDSGIIRKINLRVRSDNQVAIHLYRSLNFVYEGTITRDFFVNGKFYDSIQMGLEID